MAPTITTKTPSEATSDSAVPARRRSRGRNTRTEVSTPRAGQTTSTINAADGSVGQPHSRTAWRSSSAASAATAPKARLNTPVTR